MGIDQYAASIDTFGQSRFSGKGAIKYARGSATETKAKKKDATAVLSQIKSYTLQNKAAPQINESSQSKQ